MAIQCNFMYPKKREKVPTDFIDPVILQKIVYDLLIAKNRSCLMIIIAKSCNYCSFISGPIGEVLNWSGWAPLSRLTYAAYLIHPIVMEVYFKNMFQLIYFEHFTLVSNFEFDAYQVTACIM